MGFRNLQGISVEPYATEETVVSLHLFYCSRHGSRHNPIPPFGINPRAPRWVPLQRSPSMSDVQTNSQVWKLVLKKPPNCLLGCAVFHPSGKESIISQGPRCSTRIAIYFSSPQLRSEVPKVFPQFGPFAAQRGGLSCHRTDCTNLSIVFSCRQNVYDTGQYAQ